MLEARNTKLLNRVTEELKQQQYLLFPISRGLKPNAGLLKRTLFVSMGMEEIIKPAFRTE